MIERRKHKMFVTLNSEYHLHDKICVGVRSLASKNWDPNHITLGIQLCGAVSYSDGGLAVSHDPKEGQALWFEGPDTNVITSSVQKIMRPPKDVISHYLQI